MPLILMALSKIPPTIINMSATIEPTCLSVWDNIASENADIPATPITI